MWQALFTVDNLDALRDDSILMSGTLATRFVEFEAAAAEVYVCQLLVKVLRRP